MAIVKYYDISEEELKNKKIEAGALICCNDTGNFYFENTNMERIRLGPRQQLHFMNEILPTNGNPINIFDFYNYGFLYSDGSNGNDIIKPKSNGSIILSPSADDKWIVNNTGTFLLDNFKDTTYTLSATRSDNADVKLQVNTYDEDQMLIASISGTNSITFELDRSSIVYLDFLIELKNTESSEVTVYPQLELGGTASRWFEYSSYKCKISDSRILASDTVKFIPDISVKDLMETVNITVKDGSVVLSNEGSYNLLGTVIVN